MKSFLETVQNYDYVKFTLFLEEVFFKSDRLVRQYLYLELKHGSSKLVEHFLHRFSEEEMNRFRSEMVKQKELERDEFWKGEERMLEIIKNMPTLVKEALATNKQNMENLLQNREMLKSLEPYYYSDQTLGKLKPPAFKEIPERGEIIDLPEPSTAVIQQENIYKLISERTTLRDFKTDELSLEELSWLLWATQGVRKYIPEEKKIFRTVPSGGDRHPFETYLAVNRITGLNPGLYRFLSREHRLLFLKAEPDLVEILTDIGRGQPYVGNCAVCFIWSAIPQRTEWRYANQAKKNILIEAGHVGQNLYLATEAAGCGTCGIAAYDQKKVDELLELDGVDEFVIYLAPVGR